MENGEDTVRAGAGAGAPFVHCSQSPEGGRRDPRGGQLWFLPWEWPVPIGSLGKACFRLEKLWPRWALAQQVLKGREVMAESDLGIL